MNTAAHRSQEHLEDDSNGITISMAKAKDGFACSMGGAAMGLILAMALGMPESSHTTWAVFGATLNTMAWMLLTVRR